MSRIETLRIGDEQRMLVVIDDAAADPDALCAFADRATFTPARHAYPGVRAELPDDYWTNGREAVDRAVAILLGRAAEWQVIDASFSMVTTPRADLSVSQRLPHADAYDEGRIALVHYLGASDDEDGTAFFRHRSTRFETIDAERAPVYHAQLDAELRHGGVPAADYPAADHRLFERIAAVGARRNRAVLYHSFALHSGIIAPTASLSADPRTGRLTVTGFLAAR